ncbi:DUF3099 domain-containing protein [Streptomyces sp. O3]
MRRLRAARRPSQAAESITRARTGLTEDLRGRQRRYLLAMVVRTACVILMAVTWSRWPVVAVGALVAGVAIPFIAVVITQAGWRQGRGPRPATVRVREEPSSRVPLEPTLILPPERNAAA